MQKPLFWSISTILLSWPSLPALIIFLYTTFTVTAASSPLNVHSKPLYSHNNDQQNHLTDSNNDNYNNNYTSPHFTAILSSTAHPDAYISCIQFLRPANFTSYPTVGKYIPGIANVTNVTYVVLPPNSKEGLHKPPYPMFFVLLSGLAKVSVPPFDDESGLGPASLDRARDYGGEKTEEDVELWIRPDETGMIVAADMVGLGHHTAYPGDTESVALQIPFKGGRSAAL